MISIIGLQVVLVLYLNFFSLIYIASSKALEGKEFNNIDLKNQTLVLIITFNIVCFTDFVLEKSS